MTAPYLRRTSDTGLRMGRLPSSPVHLARRLRLSKYLDLSRVLPLLPEHHEAPEGYICRMYNNDREGCCTASAAAHIADENALSVSGHDVGFTSAQIDDLYYRTNGGVDQGANMGDVLNEWRQNGIPGPGGKAHKIIVYAALDRGNLAQLEAAMYLFDGAVFVGAALPDRVVPPGGDWVNIDWTGNAGAPNPYNGHAFSLPGYVRRGGPYYRTTWADYRAAMDGLFYNAYCDEIYVVMTTDSIDEATDKSHDGFTRSQLLDDLAEVAGLPPEPDPEPQPQPKPSCLTGVRRLVAAPLWPSGVRVYV